MIRTTAEHPFWVLGKGWTETDNLTIGEVFNSRDGQRVVIEDLLDTGEDETEYNMRINEFATYFVGSEDWNFSVWAHNACALKDLANVAIKGCATSKGSVHP